MRVLGVGGGIVAPLISGSAPHGLREREVVFRRAGAPRAPVVHRLNLEAGDSIDGPAIVEEADATIMLDIADRATVLAAGSLSIAVEQEGTR